MENTAVKSQPQTSPVIVPATKMTYEEFLHEYAGRYADYVDGQVIRDTTVSKTHDNITGFLQALSRFLSKGGGFGD